MASAGFALAELPEELSQALPRGLVPLDFAVPAAGGCGGSSPKVRPRSGQPASATQTASCSTATPRVLPDDSRTRGSVRRALLEEVSKVGQVLTAAPKA